MEPTLIMPNQGVNMNSMNTNDAPKSSRNRFTKNQIIWTTLSIIVVAFLIIYFVVKEDKSTGLSTEEKMEIVNFLKSQPAGTTTPAEKQTITESQISTSQIPATTEEKMQILNSLKSL
jgi:heme/copper-type cytochrome/quinol oxidase subunit 2